MAYEVVRRQVLFWLLWVLANTVGLGLAWMLGEAIGQVVNKETNWRTAVLVAGIIFESLIWLARGAVVRQYREFEMWRPIETVVWMTGEIIGWLIGEGTHLSSGPVWVTAGAVWGVLLGASLWFTIWFMRQPRPKGRWWFAAVPAWTFFGVIGASILIGVAMSLSVIVNEAVSRAFNPYFGLGIAGAFMGSIIGGITGLAFVRLMRWPTLETT